METRAGSGGEAARTHGTPFFLSVGRDNGAADIAVGGHGIELPPDVMGQTGLVQVILNHGQFAQSFQTRAKVQDV